MYSDFAGDKDKRKLTSFYFLSHGKNCITLKSQLQFLVTLTSTEAEYVVFSN